MNSCGCCAMATRAALVLATFVLAVDGGQELFVQFVDGRPEPSNDVLKRFGRRSTRSLAVRSECTIHSGGSFLTERDCSLASSTHALPRLSLRSRSGRRRREAHNAGLAALGMAAGLAFYEYLRTRDLGDFVADAPRGLRSYAEPTMAPRLVSAAMSSPLA